MDVGDITPEWISQILEAHRKHNPLPHSIRQLQCLADIAEENFERAIINLLHGYITSELARRRQLYSVTPIAGNSRMVDIQNIEQDARKKDASLIMWTFTYYRYVSTRLSVKEASIPGKYSDHHHRLKIREAYTHIAKFLRRCERDALVIERQKEIERTLGEAEYTQYIGMDESLERLVSHLRLPQGPRWISLEGLGGIGKTALARRVIEEIVRQDLSLTVIWLSARQQRFDVISGKNDLSRAALTAEDLIDQLWQHALLKTETPLTLMEKIKRLTEWCHQQHALIVIDNLETLNDVEALQYFEPLAGGVRFLMTSRESLRWLPFPVLIHPVLELSTSDSELLLRREYQERKAIFFKRILSDEPRNPNAIPLENEHLQEIHNTVGGFPLAIKLIAAQILTMPIDECIAGLKTALPDAEGRSEEMFTYIYRQTWRLLTPDTCLFLLSIHNTLPPEGMPIQWLYAMARAIQLSETQFKTVIEDLIYYCLIEINPKDQYHRVHRLTTTFLQKEFHRGRA